MTEKDKMQRLLKWISSYLIFFLVVAFVVSCCTMLFATILAETLPITFTEENLSVAAKVTFANVILLSFLFVVIDMVRRKYTVDIPVKKILTAINRIMQGDFSVKMSPRNTFATDDKFNEIIAGINKMTEELNSVETLRNDFITNVSHEMKTPLAVIQNYGTLLQSEKVSDEKRMEYAKVVVEGAKRLADMMTNILKLNRLENQQIYPKAAEYNLSEQLCECLLQYETVWEKKEIEIETDIAEDILIKADAELLSHVWNNLFSNAFKFTEEGGTVRISLDRIPGYAIVKVKDTGCGMSPEVGAHIFEKFYQGDFSRATQGNGLGLALVKRVMDILRGEITVESVLQRGTTFTVKIPENIGNMG